MLPPRVLTVLPGVLVALVLSIAICGATAAPTDHSTGFSVSLSENYGLVVAGGVTNGGRTSSVESTGTPPLPDLPQRYSSNTLTAIGPVIYSCVDFSCLSLDTSSSSPLWREAVTLPRYMEGHSAVGVGSHIWIAFNDTIYDLDTGTNQFTNYPTSFKIDFYHCAVSNGKLSYLLGVGEDRREVWVSDFFSPSKWTKIGEISVSRKTFACLLLQDDQILVTGGETSRNTSELFDTNTHTSQWTGEMMLGRQGHQMFLLDGKPAVAGGDDGPYASHYYSSIETFDLQAGEWSTDTLHSLTYGRSFFGLAQFAV